VKRLVLVAAVACGRSQQVEHTHPKLLATAPELVTAIVDNWDSTNATLRLWKHTATGWRAEGDAWPAVIGSAGLAWGDGVHGVGAPVGRAGPVKHEGDRKSPAGAFAIRGVYGYASKAPPGTQLPYTPVEHGWQCVDDPRSSHYTQILDRRTAQVDWSSAEEMRRDDDLYTWVIDIAHNSAHVAGNGSCIFFHVWGGPGSTTVGCTAMEEPRLAKLIGELEPTAVYVLLPRAEYDALAGPWGLPAL
jgi:D-alanyl-D-alanine dipeptidase